MTELFPYGADAPSTGELELEDRGSLRRVVGLSTELTDITEVEYRQLRLERVVLVGVWTEGSAEQAQASLTELARLAETAGSQVLDGLVQRRSRPDPATFIGSGKVAELGDTVRAAGADTVICDGELSPGQLRQLEDKLKVKVIDRTALILDIFAQHARSRDGKAQVELAQLSYLLPRLRGWGEALSRQVGGRAAGGVGIGGRGPGETKIELDRRRIRHRMTKLRRDIAAMRQVRETQRGERRRHEVPGVAIVGYTNAGKSSLLNALTGAGVLVEDALFATLDPTTRRSVTPDGRGYTLTDTVGFVRHLPHQLVEAFRSTLEETAGSDLLVHVVDASDPLPEDQIKAVRQVLVEIGEEQGGRMPQELWWSTSATPRATSPWPACATCCRTPCSSPHAAATASSGCAPGSPSCSRARTWRSSCCCPTPRVRWRRGCTTKAKCSPRSTLPTARVCTPGSAPSWPRRCCRSPASTAPRATGRSCRHRVRRLGQLSLSAALAALAVSLAPVVAVAPEARAPETSCTVDDPRLAELSGLAVVADGLWAMADGGRRVQLHRLDPDTCAVVESRTATVDPYDAEDLAAGPDGSLWVGDTGDNDQREHRGPDRRAAARRTGAAPADLSRRPARR